MERGGAFLHDAPCLVLFRKQLRLRLAAEDASQKLYRRDGGPEGTNTEAQQGAQVLVLNLVQVLVLVLNLVQVLVLVLVLSDLLSHPPANSGPVRVRGDGDGWGRRSWTGLRQRHCQTR